MDNEIDITDFSCKKCDYTCSNKHDFGKHLTTRKHIGDNTDNKKYRREAGSYSCVDCGNIYKYQSGLCKHRKVCNVGDKRISETIVKQKTTTHEELNAFKEIIIGLIKSNSELQRQSYEVQNETNKQSQEFQRQLLEICKNGTQNTNCNNKVFNINVFLNEQCKDAINFSDFVKSISVSREELTNTGQVGFVDGVSKILLDNLKQLSVNERPIHCTDVKRETMYIKDDNKWNKEENDDKMREAINMVTRQSMKTLYEWKETNPDYKDGDSEFSRQCIGMQLHSAAGANRDTFFPKVMKAVAKEVTVDKTLV